MHNIIVEDEGEDAAACLEFKNMSDPIQLPHQNPAMFDDNCSNASVNSASSNSKKT